MHSAWEDAKRRLIKCHKNTNIEEAEKLLKKINFVTAIPFMVSILPVEKI